MIAIISPTITGTGGFPYLTVLVLLPVAVALIVALLPREKVELAQPIGIGASVVVLGFAVAVLANFNGADSAYQLVSRHTWIPEFGISWDVGVDGISLFLVLLTALIFPLVLAGAPVRRELRSYTAWLLLLEAGCLGSFVSVDLIFFFLFFELTIVPVYFIIGGWGHEGRRYAATKFFVYTFLGSAFLLVGILALVSFHAGETGVTTFDVAALATTHLSGTAGVLCFLAFTAAFAVKAPIFPFHTWSPDAYGDAPAAGSVVLAGVMAKLGTYGIIRFDLDLFPHAVVTMAPWLLTLGVIGIIYGGVVAAAQRDIKRFIAYSSLAHIGFIVVGAFALTSEALTGAVLQMVNHGLFTAALFLLVAMIYRRRGTLQIPRLGGLQGPAPVIAGVFTVVMLASIGVPGLNGFIGEFLILAGTFLSHRWWAVVATAGVVVAAIYMLWVYQEVFHGKPREVEPAVAGATAVTATGATGAVTASAGATSAAGTSAAGAPTAPAGGRFRDLTWREGLVLAPLVVLIVFLGVYPRPVLQRITPTVSALVAHVERAAPATVPAYGTAKVTLPRHADRAAGGETRTAGAARAVLVAARGRAAHPAVPRRHPAQPAVPRRHPVQESRR